MIWNFNDTIVQMENADPARTQFAAKPRCACFIQWSGGGDRIGEGRPTSAPLIRPGGAGVNSRIDAGLENPSYPEGPPPSRFLFHIHRDLVRGPLVNRKHYIHLTVRHGWRSRDAEIHLIEAHEIELGTGVLHIGRNTCNHGTYR